MIKIWVLLVLLASGEVEVTPQGDAMRCAAAATEREHVEAVRFVSDVVGVMCVEADVDTAGLSDDELQGLAP